MVKVGVFILLGIILIGVVVSIFYINPFNTSNKIKISSMELVEVYRNCEKNGENYKDITLQTKINIEVKKSDRYYENVLPRDCTLKLNSDIIESFSLNVIPSPEPYIEGIQNSGLYVVTGGELTGDKSGKVVFCCQNKCIDSEVKTC